MKAVQIRVFARLSGVDLSEAAEPDPAAYPHFNAFFTRDLKPAARPVTTGERDLASPTDARVSAMGRLDHGQVFQAKGKDYSVVDLLGGSAERAAPFLEGSFITLYLSPRDYHRVHAPLSGELVETVHVPGRLFSVQPGTVRARSRLFTSNERVAAIFHTDLGPLAVVLVGALFVGAIETVWSGLVTPPRGRAVTSTPCGPGTGHRVILERGDELGRFNFGSTVIVLLGGRAVEWRDALAPGLLVRVGEKLGQVPGPVSSS